MEDSQRRETLIFSVTLILIFVVSVKDIIGNLN